MDLKKKKNGKRKNDLGGSLVVLNCFQMELDLWDQPEVWGKSVCCSTSCMFWLTWKTYSFETRLPELRPRQLLLEHSELTTTGVSNPWPTEPFDSACRGMVLMVRLYLLCTTSRHQELWWSGTLPTLCFLGPHLPYIASMYQPAVIGRVVIGLGTSITRPIGVVPTCASNIIDWT